MNRFIVLIVVVLFLSCDKSFEDARPENFIEQKMMEDILYDIKLINASRSKGFKVLKDNNVQADVYIYEKYKIDSTTLRQNIEYYASSSFKRSKDMEYNIRLRFEEAKKRVDEEIKLKDSLGKLELPKEIKKERKLDREVVK